MRFISILVLFTFRVSSLLSTLNDTSVDILDVEGSFQFFLEVEFSSPLYVHIILATDTKAESPFSVQLVQC